MTGFYFQYIIRWSWSWLLVLGALLPTQGQSLEFRRGEGTIRLLMDQKPVYRYQIATKSQQGLFPRANYLHPVYDLQGGELTEDFPPDHLHQRGIFWAWHQLFLDGKSLADPWECRGITWKVHRVQTRIREKEAILRARVKWQVENQRKPVMQEKVSIIFRPAHHYYTLDFSISLESLRDGLELGGSQDEKGYGGFSARLLLTDLVQFFHGESTVQPQNTAIQSGHWMGIRGIGDKHAAVVLMYHPQSSATLQGWILRKAESMQNPRWPGRQRVHMNRGDQATIIVRLLVTNTHPTPSMIQAVFNEFQAFDPKAFSKY